MSIAKFNSISDEQLNQKMKSLAAYERKLTQAVLHYIAEVDRRKLFFKMAYSSLFDYLTKEIGYSNGAAQRRIDAARLLQVVPELSSKIETGAVTLSQISYMQKACRQVARSTRQKISVQTKKEILTQIENQNFSTTQIKIAQILTQPIQMDEIFTQTQKTFQSDESVRLEITFTKEQMAIIFEAQAALSNKTGGSLVATFVELAKIVLQKKQGVKKRQDEEQNERQYGKQNEKQYKELDSEQYNKQDSRIEDTATVAVKENKTLTSRTKNKILNRDECCQYQDKVTGKICGSKFFLQIDHIYPQFAGGSHNPNNLRVLCQGHNLYRYRNGS